MLGSGRYVKPVSVSANNCGVCRVFATAAWEAERKAREANNEDALAMRLRRAEEEKQRKLREFDEKAREQKEIGAAELAIRERHQAAELDRQRRIGQLVEMGRVMTSTYNMG